MAASWSEGPSVFSSHAADLLVKIKKNKKNNTDAGAQPGAAPNNSAAGSGNKCEGEHACPAGMVVLDKPNKYGACCEAAKEGVCKKGLIGTPPNCTCPEGTLPLGAGDNPCVAKENCPFPRTGRKSAQLRVPQGHRIRRLQRLREVRRQVDLQGFYGCWRQGRLPIADDRLHA